MKRVAYMHFLPKTSGISIVVLLLVFSFTAKAQLIRDSATIAGIQHMLPGQKEMAAGRSQQLFDIYKNQLSSYEKQALDYLYAYMPLSDLADYDGVFFLQQVKSVLRARSEMPWGKAIPEDVFLHFVLPPRVNNENLDLFRITEYDELKKRVAGMNMHDAALEVNHWCHEKVTYRGSDERTSSPLATVKTSFGRCGEESTLTVTALRTIGIPARQVYTPRWAHTDDNHAWVEVWIDGKWYFLGACEPDPDLNMGWFAEPARRAMLVHTRAYGAYHGSEPVIDRQERFAELNLVQNYAAAKNIFVKVITTEKQPVANAVVEYQLYNYAEFYPIAKGISDQNGISSIITGLGDLLIWAYQGEKWGFTKISVDKMDSVTVVISDIHPANLFESFDFIPPVEKSPLASKVTQKDRDYNSSRLHQEDSIRSQYMAGFKDSAWVVSFAAEHGLSAGRLLPLFSKSYGNWPEIAAFLSATPVTQKDWAVYLLEVISEKDLRDTRAEVLEDHLTHAFVYSDEASVSDKEFFARYIMNGRIANEMMLPWRACLQQQFGVDFEKQLKTDINVLVEWIKANIKTDNITNLHSRAPLSPKGVYELRKADNRSRDIFFVAVCRSLGRAARINPATNLPQYFDGKQWQNVAFEPVTANISKKGFIHFVNGDENYEPKYAVNYTIARYNAGVYRTIDFDYGLKISEFAANTEVEAGKYLLVTGNRQADGSVLSSVSFFEVPANVTTEVKVNIRQDFTPASPWGRIKTNGIRFKRYETGEPVLLSSLADSKGAILIWIDPDKEPSKHVLADLPAVKELLEKWGGGVELLFANDIVSASFKPSNFPNLPAQSKFAYDKGNKTLAEIERLRNRKCSDNLPVIVIMDKNGNLIYYSEGYKIGIGEQIAKAIAPLKQ
ncbi:MAG: transglutaminase-like domain-containing protein [Bacteroidota bacterium]